MSKTQNTRPDTGLARRTLLAGMAGLVAAPAFAAVPTAIGASVWLAYEARLRARLADAGGGAFAPQTERALLELNNATRLGAGVAACAWSEELARTARAHAADLAARAYVEHLTPEGFDPTHRVGLMARRMIGSASENIAYRRAQTAPSAADLMGIWRKSEPHWTNLLRPSHAEVGFGVVTRDDKTYSVALYSRPDGELGAPLPFRIAGEADLAGALATPSPLIESFSVTDPLDEAASLAHPAGEGVLAPGVYQLRPRRRLDARRYQILWGPIFARV